MKSVWITTVRASLAAAACITVLTLPVAASAKKVGSSCTYKGKRLWGKVKLVKSFPDLKVQLVNSFPDLKVQKVNSFPDKCGKWKFVKSFPDIKVQLVNSFPDIKVKYVRSFPGLP